MKSTLKTKRARRGAVKKRTRRAPPTALRPIDYLRIGRAIGKLGYCGECMGCVCWRDNCDYADDLREHDAVERRP